jgi:RsiW-degrading membrane proteinase PrsW (M82 family)
MKQFLKLIGLHNGPMTYPDLARQFLGVLGMFVAIGVAWPHVQRALLDTPETAEIDIQIEVAYQHAIVGDLEGALEAAREAVAIAPEHKGARTLVIDLLHTLQRTPEARTLLEDEAYTKTVSRMSQGRVYLASSEYLKMSTCILIGEFTEMEPAPLIAALICGLAWFVMLLIMGQAANWPRSQIGISTVALICGFVSAAVCMIVIYLMDPHMPQPENDPARNFVYCIVGIGAKEEFIKLLLVVPLLPFLLKMRSDLTILCIVSLVGLGFAINENISYYPSDQGTAGRFLTANFFHMALTGFCGFYLVKAVQHGGDYWHTFTVTVLKMCVLHGVYDYLYLEPALAGFSLFAMTIYIWLAQVYLRLILSSRAAPSQRSIPITRWFVLVNGIVIGTSYIYASSLLGPCLAFESTLFGLLGVAVIAYMFFREFDERIE